MPGPRNRLILSATAPSLSPLLTPFTRPPSPLLPLSPLRSLKSPASFLPQSSASNSPYHNKLPFSPTLTSPHRYPAPQPPLPLAWTWRCHLCCTTYRLGTTRRCLIDGHYFCSNPPPPPPSSPSPPPSPVSATAATASPAPLPFPEQPGPNSRASPDEEAERPNGPHNGHAAGNQRKSRRRRRRRTCAKRDQQSCTGAFDYLGWADWNAWRREMSPIAAGVLGSGNAPTGLAEKCHKDCFWDCDFPSECCWQRTAAYLESVRESEGEAEGSPVVPFFGWRSGVAF